LLDAAHPHRSAPSLFVAFAFKKIDWLCQRSFSNQIARK